MTLTCEQLLQKHPQAWQQATVHPFLQQCHSGIIQTRQFNTWLVQDYLFVLELTRLFARGLANAPPAHFDVLLGGLSAIKEELNWFQTKATERQLELNAERQLTCQAYCEYMYSIAEMPYPVQATAIWAIEFAYNQAWQLPGAMPEPYAEFANRWGSPEFTEYVKDLEREADEALQAASEATRHQAESAFLKIASLEKDFWQMAFEEGRGEKGRGDALTQGKR